MSWFNVLYYVVMILAFLGCLGMALRSRREPLKATVWAASSPVVAFAAPIGIVFALIAGAVWLLFVAAPHLVSGHRAAGRAEVLPVGPRPAGV
ncbi:hypothetical protein LO771_16590 [Streptacidiphilus sp. ASG 303]|uniref:hypothetical protein n=1 Tax=Streptacidiphilus sp. ASG 303 TaxID=2896847 RepID=UPI001E44A128|nr:hypothetical protein [Streptacidiphilus sp. ASG 303]MCD0483969.1 hypothetical protein [Streptacidiphilus sp. ASG 303]